MNVETKKTPDGNRTHDLPYNSQTLYHWARGTHIMIWWKKSLFLVMTHGLYHTVNWITAVYHGRLTLTNQRKQSTIPELQTQNYLFWQRIKRSMIKHCQALSLLSISRASGNRASDTVRTCQTSKVTVLKVFERHKSFWFYKKTVNYRN